MEAATCDEPLGILLGVVCGHGVKSSGEAGDIGRSRIDQHCTVQPDLVHVFQKGFGRAGELQDPIEIGLMLFHQLEGCGTQHELERLEMGIRFTQVATSGCACRLPKGPTCWGYLSEPYTHPVELKDRSRSSLARTALALGNPTFFHRCLPPDCRCRAVILEQSVRSAL